MNWLTTTLQQLAAQSVIGYAAGQSPATEPAALAALALIAGGKTSAAAGALDFLISCQGANGAVGIRAGEPTPGWPTSLAVLAWLGADQAQGRSDYRPHARRGIDWLLEARGIGYPLNSDLAHDTRLVGWSWAEQTHSWIEPTAMHTLALKKAGLGLHARVREAVQLLVNRLLPGGGCNYGNTAVMGQVLRPHVQPTGLAMLALAGESPQSTVQGPKSDLNRDKLQRSLGYLQSALVPPITATSLAWGLLGLRAHEVEVPTADELLRAACDRVQAHDRSPYKLALLAVAAQPAAVSLFTSGREGSG